MVIKTLQNIRLYRLYVLVKQAYGNYTLQLVVLILLGFLGGLLEGVGINALIPMFSFITGQEGNDPISQYIERFFLFFNLTFSLQSILIFIVIIFIIKAVILFVIQYIKIIIAGNYLENTMHGVFSKTMSADWPYLLKQKVGHLENVVMVDALASSALLKHISMMIIIISSLIMYIIVAFNIDALITFITLAIGALLAFFFKPLFYKTRKASEKYSRTNKEVAHFVSTHVLGLKTIKSMYLSNVVIKEGAKIFSRLRTFVIHKALYREVTSALIEPISMIVIVSLFAVSYKTSEFNIAAFAAIIYLIHKIFSFTTQLFTIFHGMNSQVPHLQQVLKYQESADKEIEQDAGQLPFVFNKQISFKNIDFQYIGDIQVLSSISFSIKKGEMVGIIGESGSGKTTIIDLLLRLFQPTSGTILIDETPISSIKLSEWRNNIAYVSQDMFLLNDTVKKNITFYDDTISDEEVIVAAKLAHIYEFIKNKPNQFDTVIGERGVLLSVGQRQRIILARALARKPSILLLDEATSALDNESEVKIKKSLESLKGKTTVITIAHRLSTIEQADKLLVLDKGHIVESGSPALLLKNKESYFYKVTNILK